MKPLSIAIIALPFIPIKEPFTGGAEHHTYLLTKKLSERGHNVTLFAAKDSDPDLNIEILDKLDISEMKYANYLPYRLKKKIFYFKEFYNSISLMRKLKSGKFDIIHDNSLTPNFILLARFFSTPVVTTVHGAPYGQLKSALRFFASSNTYFITISKKFLELYTKILPPSKKIYNGVNLDQIKFSPNYATPPYAIWFGRIHPEKGMHLAIDACLEAQIPLKLIGPIQDDRYFHQEIVPRLENNKSIEYLGHFTHQELQKILSKAQVSICSPIVEEAFGLTTIESLAAGVPVAGFKRGALPEILTPLCGALAENDDIKDLSRAIKKAALCKREDCRARVEKFFDVNMMIEKYEKFYYEILKARKK